MKLIRIGSIAAVLLFASLNVWAQGKGYKVIVNPSNPMSSISRDDLSRILLKKTTKFPDGRSASPVDLPLNSSVREAFSKDVHGKPASAVEAYWQQQIFSGKDVPPAQKNEAGAVDFVRSTSNGVGYVSSGTDTDGAKVISVTD
jgi:ABC-type phosphate transport system substrate-binding protein